MDKLSKRLAKAKVIGLDTPLFIYFLENNERYGELARITINGIEKGNKNDNEKAKAIIICCFGKKIRFPGRNHSNK